MLALVRSILSLVVYHATSRHIVPTNIQNHSKLLLGWLCQLFPSARNALTIVRPETIVRCHRAGFRSYWRWKSRRRVGRPCARR
jgi:hypothetical protein